MLLKFLGGLALVGLVKGQDAEALERFEKYVREINPEDNPDCDSSLAACQADMNCSRYEYINGGGFEYLTGTDVCTFEEAVTKALYHHDALVAEAASDDIGQLMLQLEAVLEAKGLRSASDNPRCNDYMTGECDPNFYVKTDEAMDADCMCDCVNDTGNGYRVVCNHQSGEIGLIKRFKNLKAMVMTLQPVEVTVFGRYCYYGCWCLPNGQHNLAAGYGQPVDPIDEVCKEFALCYKCIDLDFAGTCNPEKKAYKWGRVRDDSGVTYDLSCKDNHERGPNHRCKRYICECDRVLAVGLGATHAFWNESHHARWGGFDREASCETDCIGCIPQDDCCGAYGSASTSAAAMTRRPYASTNPNSGCCQDVFYYNTVSQECCIDGTDVSVTDVGTCPGSAIGPDAIDDFDDTFPGYTRK